MSNFAVLWTSLVIPPSIIILTVCAVISNQSAWTQTDDPGRWKDDKESGHLRCSKLDGISLEYMKKGHGFFIEKNFNDALRYFGDANVETPGNTDIVENIAECWMNLGYYYRALDKADKILEMEMQSLPGVYYKTQALLRLGHYLEGISFLTYHMTAVEELRKSKYLQSVLNNLHRMEFQGRSGEISLKDLYSVQFENGSVANYAGAVKIVEVPGKGRGLVATEDILTGKLLIVETAFAFVVQEEEDPKNSGGWKGYRELAEAVAKKLEVEPEHREWIYKMYSGPEMESYKTDSKIDYQRISGIVSYNSVLYNMESLNGTDLKGRGLWILPAYANHNCLDSNAFWLMYRDTMVIRAGRNISKGEEILVNYFSASLSFEERDNWQQQFGFQCTCSLCNADRNDSESTRQQRKDILSQIEHLEGEPTAQIAKLQNLIDKLEDLRPENPELNVYIVKPLLRIWELYYSVGDYPAAVQSLIKAHDVLRRSPPFVTESADYSTRILKTYAEMGNKKESLQWFNVLKRHLFILYGTNDIFSSSQDSVTNKQGM